jgi:hypothetical protein
MAQPYLEKLQQLLSDVDIESADVASKHFFSGAAAYANGHIFASLTPKGLALKFPESRCKIILANEFAEPLRYFDKSPVKRGYVLFPDYGKLEKTELKQYFLESKSAAAQDTSR